MFIKNIKLSAKVIKKFLLKNFYLFTGTVFCIGMLVVVFSISKNGNSRGLHRLRKYDHKLIKISMSDSSELRSAGYINSNYVRKLKYISDYIESVSPEVCFKGILSNGFNNLKCFIVCGNEDYKRFSDIDMIHGRFLTEYECVNKLNVVVIDRDISIELFGTENSIGREVYIENNKKKDLYKIVGVIKYRGNVFNGRSFCRNYFCIIPFENYVCKFSLYSEFDCMYASIKSDDNFEDTCNSIINFLRIVNDSSDVIYRVEDIKCDYQILSKVNSKIRILILGLSIYILSLTVMNVTNSIKIKKFKDEDFEEYSFLGIYIIQSIMTGLFITVCGIILGVVISGLICLVYNMKVNATCIYTFLFVHPIVSTTFGVFPFLKYFEVNNGGFTL